MASPFMAAHLMAVVMVTIVLAEFMHVKPSQCVQVTFN
jgi:hypothetical protein